MCKIGISTDPELRLAALQTGSHVALKLHYVLAFNNIDPRQIEYEAHRLLDRYRCAGEWFDVTPQMAEEAVNAAGAHFGIKTVQTTSDNLGQIGQPPPLGFNGWLLRAAVTIAALAALSELLSMWIGR